MSDDDANLRLLLVASSGGHLTQLLALRPWWSAHQRSFVTFDSTQARSALTDESVVFAYAPTTRNIPNLLRNARLAWTLLRRERPDVVVTTGAGVALPFIVLGRFRGATTVFIEVFDRIEMPTLTGRLCRPFCTAVLVQWDEQRTAYPQSINVGPLL